MKKGMAIGIGCGVLFLIVLGCAGLFGGLAWLGIGMYKGTTRAADSFLNQLGSGDVNGAYQSGATDLRQQQTLEQFTINARQLQLTEYQSASWSNVNIVNNQGTVEGMMTTKSGGAVPLKVTLVKENGAWKVSAVSSTVAAAAGVGNPPDHKPMPSDADLQKLATRSLLDFNKGVQSKDFSLLYGTLSELWKRQTTPAKLEDVFKDFIDNRIDISKIANSTPVFEKKPAIIPDGVLELDGYYPTKPIQVRFSLKYTYEYPNWKLMGIRVKTEE